MKNKTFELIELEKYIKSCSILLDVGKIQVKKFKSGGFGYYNINSWLEDLRKSSEGITLEDEIINLIRAFNVTAEKVWTNIETINKLLFVELERRKKIIDKKDEKITSLQVDIIDQYGKVMLQIERLSVLDSIDINKTKTPKKDKKGAVVETDDDVDVSEEEDDDDDEKNDLD